MQKYNLSGDSGDGWIDVLLVLQSLHIQFKKLKVWSQFKSVSAHLLTPPTLFLYIWTPGRLIIINTTYYSYTQDDFVHWAQ